MFHRAGLGQDGGDGTVDPTTLAIEDLLAGYGEPVGGTVPYSSSPVAAYVPANTAGSFIPTGYLLTSQGDIVPDTSGQAFPSTDAALDAKNQTIANALANVNSVSSAQTAMTAAAKLLSQLVASGANAAQIAVAQSNSAKAQAAYAKLVAQAAGTGACSTTILKGVCDSYVLLGGLAIGVMIFAMSVGKR